MQEINEDVAAVPFLGKPDLGEAGSDQEFDLKQYCEITLEGRQYLKLRDELLLSGQGESA